MIANSLALALLVGGSSSALADLEVANTWRVPAVEYPESITYDKANKRILLSSLVSNSISSLDTTNDMAVLATYTPDTGGPAGALGIKFDSSSGYVHLAPTDFLPPSSPTMMDKGGYALLELDPTSDEANVVTTLSFPCLDGETGCGMANDIAIAGDTIYETDNFNGRVFMVKDGEMELVTDDALLLSQDMQIAPFGANGILYDDRGFLIVGNYQQKTLLRVDLETKEVMIIPVDGESGMLDGLLMGSNGHVYAVDGMNLKVIKDNDDEWMSATIVDTLDLSGLGEGEVATSVTFGDTESELYITFVRFNDLFSQAANDDPSLLAKVMVKTTEETPEVVGSTEAPEAGSTEAPEDEHDHEDGEHDHKEGDDTATTTTPPTSSAAVNAIGVISLIAAGTTSMLF